MLSIITACLYGVLAVLICLFMVRITNKRLRTCHPGDIEDENVRPYAWGVTAWLLLAAIAAASAAAGYVTAQKVVVLSLIKLGICYFAVLAAAIIDYKTKTIPNVIPIALVIARVIIFVYELLYSDSAIEYLVGSLIAAGLFLVLLIIANKISKGGIGGGDIKLIAGIGFVTDINTVISSVLLALVCCIIVSGVLLALKKCSTKDQVPFGPFIYIGYLIMCLLTLY